jgi:acyl-coenzyme A synthetase/AMP-(fatty) acid ligase
MKQHTPIITSGEDIVAAIVLEPAVTVAHWEVRD